MRTLAVLSLLVAVGCGKSGGSNPPEPLQPKADEEVVLITVTGMT